MITNTDFIQLPSGAGDSTPSPTLDNNVFNDSDKRCPECGDTAFDHDPIRAEVACMNCGLVLSGPPCWVAGRLKVVYPWRYTFEVDCVDQHGRPGYFFSDGG